MSAQKEVDHFKIVLLGDGGVGKTSITIQLTSNHFVDEYDPTIEDTYRKQWVIDDQACLLEILDTAGREEFTELRDKAIRDADGFVLVYSITSHSSFEQIWTYQEQVIRVTENTKVPIILVGNKIDLGDKRQVENKEGIELTEKLHLHSFLESSAKTRENIEEIFVNLVRQIRKRKKIHRKSKKNNRNYCILI
jgi:GTPase KRas protein